MYSSAMQLKSIKLENYRNYKELKIELAPANNLNLFIGNNAQGKTNFLEAITVLSLAKSFRISNHEALIMWGEEYARIVGEFDNSELEFFVSVKPRRQKNLKKNGVNVQGTRRPSGEAGVVR